MERGVNPESETFGPRGWLYDAGKVAASSKRRVNKYRKAFRQAVLERMGSCQNVTALAEELGVDRAALHHAGGLHLT